MNKQKNVILMFKAILTILILIMIAGIASAIQDPFLVYGYVKYDNGSVVDGATVNISVPDQALAETTNSMGKYTGVLDRYQDGDEIIVTTVKGLYTGSAAAILDKSSGGLMINITMQDTAAPRSITSLQSTTGNFWINWTWTNPDDSDFGYSEVYIDNVWTANVSDTYYNGSYSAHSIKTISIKTVDLNSNVNNTWMNQTTAIPNNPVLLTNISSSIATAEGQTVYIDADAIDADGDSLTYSASGLPAGARFNTASGAFSWTPADGQAGTYVVTFEVTDGYINDSEAVAITVNELNHAPVLASIGAKSTNEGSTLEFTISATDPDSDPLTYSATGLPTGASFNPDTRTFSWTPDENQAGMYQVHFEVTDGSLSDAEDVTITVIESSIAPSLVSVLPSSVQVTPAASFTLTIPITPATPITGAQFNLLYNGALATVTTVTEGNLLNQDGAATLFNSGTIDNTAGTVTNVYGSVLNNTNVSSQGSFATISMTAGSATGYLNLDLTNVKISDANSNATPYTLTNATVLIDTAPVLTQIGARSVDEGSALTFTLDASDADSDSLTYSATNLPTGASFNTATGAFSWTPADGQANTYVVTFEVTDSYISDSEDVTITANDANHAPVITTFVPENSLTYNESDVITIGIIASDADGQALSYTIKIDGVTKSTSSSYVWETDYSSAGTHTIDITVSDGIEQVTDQRTITINDVHPRWDVNEDGIVNVLDISIVGQNYGTSVEAPYPRWDVNQDGDVNIQDMTLAGYHFGETVA